MALKPWVYEYRDDSGQEKEWGKEAVAYHYRWV